MITSNGRESQGRAGAARCTFGLRDSRLVARCARAATLFVAVGCGEGTGSLHGPDASGSGGAAGSASRPGGSTANIDFGGDANELFDAGSIPTFDLTLPPERWEQLISDARDEEYVEADLAFEGQPVGTVGLRFKGYGTLFNCFDGDALVCDKLSIKLKFSEYEPRLRFFGHSGSGPHRPGPQPTQCVISMDYTPGTKSIDPRSEHEYSLSELKLTEMD